MDGAQAARRALSRAARLQGPAEESDRQASSCVATQGRRGRAGRRKRGWRRLRRDVRLADTAEDNLEQNDCDPRSGKDYYPWDDLTERCWHVEWWQPLMPSRAFARDGLVHMSISGEPHAFCGVYGAPYGVLLCSSDAALEYAAMLAIADDEVTCLGCIVEMWMNAWRYEDDDLAP